jgi:hypothetical protein
LVAADLAAFVQRLRFAREAVFDDEFPDPITVAFYYGVRGAMFQDFVRKQRRVNAAVYDPGSAGARFATDLVAAQSVAGVNADADDVASVNVYEIYALERFIDQVRVAPLGPGGRG